MQRHHSQDGLTILVREHHQVGRGFNEQRLELANRLARQAGGGRLQPGEPLFGQGGFSLFRGSECPPASPR